MRTIRAVVIDDEPMARARLSRLLRGLDGVDVVAQFSDGAQALRELSRVQPDVAFIDISMPTVDGFQLIEAMESAHRPLIVFVTAYGEHALRAFDHRALDYLLKQFSAERLAETIQRVRDRMHAAPVRPSATDDYPKRIAVPDGARMRLVPVDDIELITAQGNYLELRLADRTLLLREPLSTLMQRLDPRRFVRIHRSRAVRIDLVEHVEAYGAARYWLRLRGGTGFSTGRSYRSAVRQAFGLDRG